MLPSRPLVLFLSLFFYFRLFVIQLSNHQISQVFLFFLFSELQKKIKTQQNNGGLVSDEWPELRIEDSFWDTS